MKKAYRSMMKLYHPDAGNTEDQSLSQQLSEAYEYLIAHPLRTVGGVGQAQRSGIYGQGPIGSPSGRVLQATAPRGGRVLGQTGGNYYTESNYDSYAKQYQKQKAQAQKDRQERLEQLQQEEKHRQETYDRAMEAIRAIQAAEAIKALIREQEPSE